MGYVFLYTYEKCSWKVQPFFSGTKVKKIFPKGTAVYKKIEKVSYTEFAVLGCENAEIIAAKKCNL